jgi:hypothetical protein
MLAEREVKLEPDRCYDDDATQIYKFASRFEVDSKDKAATIFVCAGLAQINP